MKIKYIFSLLLISFSNAFNPNIPPNVAKQIVKTTSGILPNADSIGHNVLHGNKLIIDYLLDHNEIAMQYKKPFILFLIETARMGDDAGSRILDIYYNLVNHML